ncbi:hypothetical protein D018_4332A, partial [Vibrio parahaemolyticus VP2007-007]|jgi:restriction system protein
MTA